MMDDDMQLVREFAAHGSEPAFTALVGRHAALVHSAALRQAGDPHLAEEISQAVFLLLARKAGQLGPATILPAWLYRTTRFVAAEARRARRRRERREQEAFMQATLHSDPADTAWQQLAPALDDALARLREADRAAVVLRYFENKSTAEVAAALHINQAAAQKRVVRALGKLRLLFIKRGITMSAALIGSALAAHAVQAAPAGLAQTISAVAVTKGAAASTTTLTLIKGALKIMAWTKAKTVIVVSAAALLATGTATVAIKEIKAREYNDVVWQNENNVNSEWLRKAPPMIKIVPTKFPNGAGAATYRDNGLKMIGFGWSIKGIFSVLYGYNTARIATLAHLSETKYDFIVTLPSKGREKFEAELQKQFGVKGTGQIIETNVFLLHANSPHPEGLRISSSDTFYRGSDGTGQIVMTNLTMVDLADALEMKLKIPVVDGTGLTNHYDFTLKWDAYGEKSNPRPIYPNLAGLKQALLDQLGLDLIPTNMPIQMLVIEKAK